MIIGWNDIFSLPANKYFGTVLGNPKTTKTRNTSERFRNTETSKEQRYSYMARGGRRKQRGGSRRRPTTKKGRREEREKKLEERLKKEEEERLKKVEERLAEERRIQGERELAEMSEFLHFHFL